MSLIIIYDEISWVDIYEDVKGRGNNSYYKFVLVRSQVKTHFTVEDELLYK